MRNYASRLDRIYLSKLFSKIEDTVTYPVSFSDHLCVCVTLDIAQNIQLSRLRWRLNVSLLKTDIIKENFNIIWFHIQRRKQMFPNLIDWWEIMAKPQFKQFYIHQGKEQKRLSQGLTIYYEKKLRTLYEKANNENVLDYEKIKQIKNKIDSYREKAVEGIRIRSRVQDVIYGEQISRYLIAKQKDIAQKKIITKIVDDNGSVLTSNSAIKKYALKFYQNLYSNCACDNEKQTHFLSFLQNELSDEDRCRLCAPMSKIELYITIN